ncbi:MAG: flagellar export protein FliJ [Cellulosilyticum sp.]|nr:flagellar export protein FliJ [Cellulosilyticum sp.]
MFKFTLEPVLALKEKMEESKKRELGLATMHQEKVHQEKLVLEKKKEDALNQVRKQNNQSMDILSIKAFNHYNSYMDRAIKTKGQQLEEAKQKVSEKREELLEAVKERKILDNLKTIYRESFEEEEKRDEQRILDDIVTYRFGNRGKG